MFATIIFILGLYLLFKFVDDGLGMFDGVIRTLRQVSKRKKARQAQPGVEDHHWKGIMIGFFFGMFFMLLLLGYYLYTR